LRSRHAIALLLCACTGEVEQPIGLLEPLRVVGGQFVESLPEAPGKSAPIVTSIDTASGIVGVGQQGRVLTGRSTASAYAVALRFAGLGTGWWVQPVQDEDPMFPGERDFLVRYDVGGGVPPGLHSLQLAAVDEAGRRGPPFELAVCVRDPDLPDNLNACDPTIAPPAVVVVLEWDRPLDLDLVVETPDGKRIAWKSPSSATSDGVQVPADLLKDPALGRLIRDSNGDCNIDGRNAEAVVWQETPARGAYLVYADLFAACGEPGALFSVAVYVRRARADGTFFLEETERAMGSVLDLQAVGGAGAPLYVMSFEP